MNAALSASSRGAECRSAALAAVEGYLVRLDELMARAQGAQRDAEAAVPGGAAGLMDEVEIYDDEDNDDGQYGASYARENEAQQGQQEGGGSAEGAGSGFSGDEMHLAQTEKYTATAEAVAAIEEDALVLQEAPPALGDERMEILEVVAAAVELEEGVLAAAQTGTPFSNASSASIPDIDKAVVGAAEVEGEGELVDLAETVAAAAAAAAAEPGGDCSGALSSASAEEQALAYSGGGEKAAQGADSPTGDDNLEVALLQGESAEEGEELQPRAEGQQLRPQLGLPGVVGAEGERALLDAVPAMQPLCGAGGAGQGASSALLSGSTMCASSSYSGEWRGRSAAARRVMKPGAKGFIWQCPL
jgi:hypothetical protein